MQKKDNIFSRFCEFKALVEKDTGRKAKTLRSNNCEEYVLNEFKNICASKGIRRELITPHNQN